MSKIQDKLSNTKFNFSQNFFKSLIAPAIAVVFAVVFAFIFGFNKGLDYTGGIVVSVVFGVDTNLEDSKVYNECKENVDSVLNNNQVYGDVYSVEINDKQEYTLVVKFAYNGADDAKQDFVSDLKEDLKLEFYSQMSDEDLQKNNYIIVEEFGSSVDNNVIMYSALATLICSVVMCVYIALRAGLNAGILSFLSAIFNNIFALAMIMVTRIQFVYATFAVIPFVTIVSILSAFMYLKKAKTMLANSQNYDKQPNAVLANDATKSTAFNQILLECVSGLALLIIGLFNICNSVLYVALALFVAVAVVLYTNILLLPGLFAKTYVRKVKKVKTKEQKPEEKKLTEQEVMQETDLDNLVSN